jgi:cellulose synthase/poly-beta-1,6-N-acetylglucosamine synthase-like glycosyltransferase
MVVVEIVFWVALGALLWTHVGYPLAAALAARGRRRRVQKGSVTPPVSIVVAAHDEEDVIERRVRNLLDLDYPPHKLEVVVASDASTDRTDEIIAALAESDPRVRLVRCPRGGKVAAQNRGVRDSSGEIVGFSDANAVWEPGALRALVANFADPAVGYVTGRASYEAADGTNREGAYWRFELWVREQESRLGSVTAGNGPIYAVRRSDWVDLEPWCGHDLGLPYLMVRRHRRAVYEPDAVSVEKPSRDLEDEYRRKVRMLRGAWVHVFTGGMLRGVGPLYFAELFSHRFLRYASGLLHVVLLVTSVALVGEGWVYRVALAGQLAWLVLAAAGRLRLPIPGAGLAYYYFLVTWATLAGLARYVRFGPPLLWERVEGTR